MKPLASEEIIRPATFGRRKLMPRVCIADSKPHLRTYLADTMEDLGFITFECGRAAELSKILDLQVLDLVILGLSAGGIEAGRLLEILAAGHFEGKVLLVAVPDSILAFAARQLGRELGIDILPTLPTPFTAESLRHSVTALLPAEAPPSPAVDVAEALKAGWLELWYQRKIDARTLMPRGAEALIRMRHPSWGVVPPAHFIPDRNDSSFYNLSDFVIGRVIDDWHYFVERNGPVDLSINLPMAFLENSRAVDDLCRRMPSHPAFGGLLIELKSAEVIENLNLMIDVARQMRFHNIAISIDNLGAEWPALMGLQVFPFAEIKVDRKFITGFSNNRLKQTVCRSIIDLAENYGVRTVAEGVETREDFVAAHRLGFDLAQGFLFGKAMTSKKFARLALAHPVTMAQ